MLKFGELVKDVHPGLFVHSVYIEEDLDKDRRAGFVSIIHLKELRHITVPFVSMEI